MDSKSLMVGPKYLSNYIDWSAGTCYPRTIKHLVCWLRSSGGKTHIYQPQLAAPSALGPICTTRGSSRLFDVPPDCYRYPSM